MIIVGQKFTSTSSGTSTDLAASCRPLPSFLPVLGLVGPTFLLPGYKIYQSDNLKANKMKNKKRNHNTNMPI